MGLKSKILLAAGNEVVVRLATLLLLGVLGCFGWRGRRRRVELGLARDDVVQREGRGDSGRQHAVKACCDIPTPCGGRVLCCVGQEGQKWNVGSSKVGLARYSQ